MTLSRKSIREIERPFSTENLPAQRYKIQNIDTGAVLAEKGDRRLVIIPIGSVADPKIRSSWIISPENYGEGVRIFQPSLDHPSLYDSLQFILPTEVFIDGMEFPDQRQTWFISSFFVPLREPIFSISPDCIPRKYLEVDKNAEGALVPVLVPEINFTHHHGWSITLASD